MSALQHDHLSRPVDDLVHEGTGSQASSAGAGSGLPVSCDISVTRVVAADRDVVFRFLSDLENHWLIADRFVEVLDLDGPPGARTGGHVRIRGPLGIRRTARTQVDFARPVEEMGGSAQLGRRTSADVRWLLRPGDGTTAVTLGAHIRHAGRLDRLLLALGGTAWMRQRFAGTLRTLDSRLRAADGRQAPEPS